MKIINKSLLPPQNPNKRPMVRCESNTIQMTKTLELTSLIHLHEKVEWFYRQVCAQLDVPISSQFISEVINKTFKTQAKSVSRSIVINTGMFTEKNAFVICQTLKNFQKKIVSFEINHNLLELNDKEIITACPNAVYLVGLL